MQPVNKTYNTIEPKVIDSLLRARETHSSYLKVETKRVPRRVLHFSDGVIEEFSTDDEAEREEEERRQREASQQVTHHFLFENVFLKIDLILHYLDRLWIQKHWLGCLGPYTWPGWRAPPPSPSATPLGSALPGGWASPVPSTTTRSRRRSG